MRLIPVLLPKVRPAARLPLALAGLHRIDLTEGIDKVGIGKLVAAIMGHVPKDAGIEAVTSDERYRQTIDKVGLLDALLIVAEVETLELYDVDVLRMNLKSHHAWKSKLLWLKRALQIRNLDGWDNAAPSGWDVDHWWYFHERVRDALVASAPELLHIWEFARFHHLACDLTFQSHREPDAVWGHLEDGPRNLVRVDEATLRSIGVPEADIPRCLDGLCATDWNRRLETLDGTRDHLLRTSASGITLGAS